MKTEIPKWLKPVMIFSGICTPGGFLFLLALLLNTNISFDPIIWFILAIGGGFLGSHLHDKVVQQ